MKKYSKFNFFKHTFCDWQLVQMQSITGKQPDYKSKAGSEYYFEKEGLYRYSNHWGRAANCRWRLKMEHKNNNGYYLGYAKWEDFYPNNEKDDLFVIIYDKQNASVDFAHKSQLPQFEGVVRNASATSKRIAKIREILQKDTWYKYIDNYTFDQAQEFIIDQLIKTNEDFLAIKRKLLHK
ncbi:hypothetical protein ACYSNM_04190 [Myroides sp. LJL116]